MKFKMQSPVQTKKIARELALNLIKSPLNNKQALAITLKGDLGAGKTTFTQGFLRGLGVKSKITSPTFVIIKTYNLKLTTDNLYKKAIHIDCYRMKNAKDILVLGFKDILSDPKNIILIEWPERVSKILPKNKISIILEHGKTLSERFIEIK